MRCLDAAWKMRAVKVGSTALLRYLDAAWKMRAVRLAVLLCCAVLVLPEGGRRHASNIDMILPKRGGRGW